VRVDTASRENFCDAQLLTPQGIQSFGLLMVVNGHYEIVQVSENAGDFLGPQCGQILGRNLRDFFSAADTSRFMEAVSLVDAETEVLTVRLIGPGSAVDLFASIRRQDDGWLIEFELPDPDPMYTQLRKRHRISREAMALKQCATLAEMCTKAAADIKAVTGFDKVMVYRFDEKWHGTVVAEVMESDMDVYMDLRFPATDIPAPVRKLYGLNPVRMIVDATQKPVPLVAQPYRAAVDPLDLNRCVLRAAAPVHAEYLANMRIVASTSVSIVKNGVLWGLFALHHRSAKAISPDMRHALLAYADSFSTQLAIQELNASVAKMSEVRDIQKLISSAFPNTGTRATALPEVLRTMAQTLGAKGITLLLEGQQMHWGEVPGSGQELQALRGWVAAHHKGPVYCTDELSAHYPSGSSIKHVASGLLAISLSDDFQEGILCYRPELVRTVQWAGDPSRAVRFDERTSNYHPRNSFNIWKEEVKNQSLAWESTEIRTAHDIRFYLIEAILNMRSRQLKSMTGLLPICAWCKKIKDDDGTWSDLEDYIERKTSVAISHGMCPVCYSAYPDAAAT
jgi:two-component system, chemotaxis family, sensor kinase Cph1